MSFLALVVFGSEECCFGGARDWLLAVTHVLGCSGCGAVAGGVFQRLLLDDFSLVRDVTWIAMIKNGNVLFSTRQIFFVSWVRRFSLYSLLCALTDIQSFGL